MLTAINNTAFVNRYNLTHQQSTYEPRPYIKPQLQSDTLTFTGKSPCELYKSVFDYMAAEIFDANKIFHIDGGQLNANKIRIAVQDLFDKGRAYFPHKQSIVEKIKWKSYIPQDVRVNSIDKINEARAVRMAEWRGFLENPENALSDRGSYNSELVKKINENPSLRFIIWHSITSEIKVNNRHIPVPFDEKALLDTIKGFEHIAPKDRKVRCSSPSFLEIYTHRLRDNLLMKMGKSGDKPVWIKIPSIAHDPKNKETNIANLEILSCRNWCTRSSIDKAEAALEDGDFYIYLKRGKSELWEPLIGMTTAHGKIDQIQGAENNNIVTLNLVDEVENFIKSHNLKCHSGIVDEGPKARQAILISKKLNEAFPETKPPYSFAKAIKENDYLSVFKFLDIKVKRLEDGMFEISGYKPSYVIDKNSGLTVPYSMFGINEDELLQGVKVISGNLVLDSKHSVFNSRITYFPQNLEKVTGRVSCSAEQYQKFGADIERVVDGDKSRIIIHR